jgi:hypothetical protein
MLIKPRGTYPRHSIQTAWPWYPDITSVSNFAEQDVVEGRRRKTALINGLNAIQ